MEEKESNLVNKIKIKRLIIILIIASLIKLTDENLNEIKIVLNKTKGINITNSNFYNREYDLDINGISLTNINNYENYLTKELNNITIKWKIKLISCNNMFKDLSNIIEIDASNLDSSCVTDIWVICFIIAVH